MKKTVWTIVFLLLALLAASLLSFTVGSASLSMADILAAFNGQNAAASMILFQIRLPRLLLSMVVGAALAGSGALMQGIFKNPMADPHILGVSSGAALGAAVGMVFFSSVAALAPFAFSFAMGTVFLVWMISGKGKGGTVALLLSGTAISAFLSAMVSCLMLVDYEQLEHVYLWTMGSLSSATWDKLLVCAPLAILPLLFSLLFTKDLNAMLLGDQQAASLGVSVRRTRLIVITLAALSTSAAVSVSGVIGFIGLIVPHAVRFILGANHEKLLPVSILTGALVLSLTDTVARTIIAPSEIPIGVLTALLGAPFFVVLLRRSLKGGAQE